VTFNKKFSSRHAKETALGARLAQPHEELRPPSLLASILAPPNRSVAILEGTSLQAPQMASAGPQGSLRASSL
jgi:hypothetical protein